MDHTVDPVMAYTSVKYATKVLVIISIWQFTTGYIQENVHMYVMNVGSVSHSLVTLRFIASFIRVSVHICVKNVGGVSDEQHICRNMLSYIQGKDLMYALSVQGHLYASRIWKTMPLYTLWTGHISVSCAPKLLQHQHDYEDISSHTRILHEVRQMILRPKWWNVDYYWESIQTCMLYWDPPGNTQVQVFANLYSTNIWETESNELNFAQFVVRH